MISLFSIWSTACWSLTNDFIKKRHIWSLKQTIQIFDNGLWKVKTKILVFMKTLLSYLVFHNACKLLVVLIYNYRNRCIKNSYPRTVFYLFTTWYIDKSYTILQMFYRSTFSPALNWFLFLKIFALHLLWSCDKTRHSSRYFDVYIHLPYQAFFFYRHFFL